MKAVHLCTAKSSRSAQRTGSPSCLNEGRASLHGEGQPMPTCAIQSFLASMKAVHLCTAKLQVDPEEVTRGDSASMKAVHLCTAKRSCRCARHTDRRASMKAVHLCTAKPGQPEAMEPRRRRLNEGRASLHGEAHERRLPAPPAVRRLNEGRASLHGEDVNTY